MDSGNQAAPISPRAICQLVEPDSAGHDRRVCFTEERLTPGPVRLGIQPNQCAELGMNPGNRVNHFRVSGARSALNPDLRCCFASDPGKAEADRSPRR